MTSDDAIRPSGDEPQGSYDVAILGGGLAGLTLGMQLKQARPSTSVFIAEKRRGPAPEAAFKVGESTVECGANYFAEVVGMKDHLEAEQLHKMALRYFWPAGDNRDLAQRVENGPAFFPPVPSYQIDRGRFENELARRNLAAGVDLFDDCRVEGVELDPAGEHRVTVRRDGAEKTVSARWVVDAAGRAFILKRKLGLEQDNGHDVDAAWFRLAGGLDYEKWVEDDPEWFARIINEEKGLRHFSTTHLMGKGYWVWLIPLASGPVSIGIVSDPRYHPFERISPLDAALDWIREHEPQLGEVLDGRRDQIEDFLKIQNFSYACRQVFSAEGRWCLVGESGLFLDPFYSPGSDFIAIGNTLTTDLVTRDLDGEDVEERARVHEDLIQWYYRGFLNCYEGQYEMWGNPLAMSAKVAVNFMFYWGAITPLFFHRKLTDIPFMAAVRDDIERISDVNAAVERTCLQWHRLDDREWRRCYISLGEFRGLAFMHVHLAAGMDDDALREKIAHNRRLMEAAAVIVFHTAAIALGDDAPDHDQRVNPYAIGLDPARWEEDGLFSEDGLTLAEAREIAENFENIIVPGTGQWRLPPTGRPGPASRV